VWGECVRANQCGKYRKKKKKKKEKKKKKKKKENSFHHTAPEHNPRVAKRVLVRREHLAAKPAGAAVDEQVEFGLVHAQGLKQRPVGDALDALELGKVVAAADGTQRIDKVRRVRVDRRLMPRIPHSLGRVLAEPRRGVAVPGAGHIGNLACELARAARILDRCLDEQHPAANVAADERRVHDAARGGKGGADRPSASAVQVAQAAAGNEAPEALARRLELLHGGGLHKGIKGHNVAVRQPGRSGLGVIGVLMLLRLLLRLLRLLRLLLLVVVFPALLLHLLIIIMLLLHIILLLTFLILLLLFPLQLSGKIKVCWQRCEHRKIRGEIARIKVLVHTGEPARCDGDLRAFATQRHNTVDQWDPRGSFEVIRLEINLVELSSSNFNIVSNIVGGGRVGIRNTLPCCDNDTIIFDHQSKRSAQAFIRVAVANHGGLAVGRAGEFLVVFCFCFFRRFFFELRKKKKKSFIHATCEKQL
jgi:hypothetical protein